MATPIIIKAGDVILEGELNDSPTARAIAAALPIRTQGNRWGEEIYFEIPIDAQLEENARQVVDAGDIAYWPTGRAFCLFFGPTPASQGDEIRAASPVNVIGRITGDYIRLVDVADNAFVSIEPNG